MLGGGGHVWSFPEKTVKATWKCVRNAVAELEEMKVGEKCPPATRKKRLFPALGLKANMAAASRGPVFEREWNVCRLLPLACHSNPVPHS